MALLCILELENNRVFLSKTDDPISLFNLCLKSNHAYFKVNKPKKIIFVDICDMALKIGQMSMKYGPENVKYDGMDGFKINEKPVKKGIENHGKKWTLEEKNDGFNDYNNKMSVKDIAIKNKRTIGAVVSEIHSRIPKSTETFPEPTKKGDKWTPEENTQLFEYYNTGISMKTIVEKLGRSKRAVECHLIQLGLYKF